jgi:hypothetical protein
MRCEAGLGERGNGKVDGRGFRSGSQPCRSYANLIDDGPINRRKGLTYAANAGAAVHSINLQCEFRHVFLPDFDFCWFDDSCVTEIRT